MSDDARLFFQWGTQYYVAGRYSSYAFLNPVAGNLLHHAVEMLLKGVLSRSMSLKELYKLRHNLPKIWEEFKKVAESPPLTKFDSVVADLHKYEDIRYPDQIVSLGLSSAITVTDLDGNTLTVDHTDSATEHTPQHKLDLNDIDELVAAIFRCACCDMQSFLPRSQDAESYLYRDNREFR